VLLEPRGADPARRGLGHAVSARVRVGVLPGAGTRRERPQGRDGDAMTRYVFKMPDLGEGTVEAEIVAWHVKVGDDVAEDQVMAEVMTEKAAVEVPSPVTGRVVSITGSPGDMVPVGAELIVFETETADDDVAAAPAPPPTPASTPVTAAEPAAPAVAAPSTAPVAVAAESRRHGRV